MLASKNAYFAALPAKLRDEWAGRMRLREVVKGEPIDLTSPRGYAYFPITALAVQNVVGPDGSATFIRFNGANMVAGLSTSLDRSDLRYENHWCCPGHVFEISRRTIFDSLSHPARKAGEAEYARMVLARVVTRVRCAEQHSGAERLARLLSEALDAQGHDGPLALTHQELADLLLTRRETVSVVLGEWADAGVVALARGSISVQDRDRLHRLSCPCHQEILDNDRRGLDSWRAIEWDRRFC